MAKKESAAIRLGALLKLLELARSPRVLPLSLNGREEAFRRAMASPQSAEAVAKRFKLSTNDMAGACVRVITGG